ncbi:MAG: hypothetical protein DRI44_01685 [Chlamydiae bacterium]|nr:MAG: hypothetical protein DRI44_01685 [Chlamydiota bacterium]
MSHPLIGQKPEYLHKVTNALRTERPIKKYSGPLRRFGCNFSFFKDVLNHNPKTNASAGINAAGPNTPIVILGFILLKTVSEEVVIPGITDITKNNPREGKKKESRKTIDSNEIIKVKNAG